MGKAKVILSPEASQRNRVVELKEMGTGSKEAIDLSDHTHQRALKRQREREKFITIPDEVAKHNFYTANYKWDIGNKNFKDDDDSEQRFVSKCYPLSPGGMLLVSEPVTEHEIKRAFEKHKVMRKLGLRHFVMEPDTSLYDALEQLGEL